MLAHGSAQCQRRCGAARCCIAVLSSRIGPLRPLRHRP
ncbi:hypothetical protein C725_1646 [Pacificimonas flava]|uniref:Uncharacterized protein n=1 Tax=Pacificimonas flava TaxID=1234595 RepID=M2U4Y2_9SPHN|nr:hypothetical protein C725_1646 [Pacificimonas flava]